MTTTVHGRSGGSRRPGLAVLPAAVLMIILDGTIVTVALPSNQRDLGFAVRQGHGGAMVSAVSLGMIVPLYPQPRERAKAIGAFSFVGAAGASIGLVLASDVRTPCSGSSDTARPPPAWRSCPLR